MQYLNVNLSGLRGKNHPCLSNIISVNQVQKLRPHLKLLSGDYLTYKTQFERSQKGSPLCIICELQEEETILHILAICPHYEATRIRILKEIEITCEFSKTKLNFNSVVKHPKILTQFILDPTSFNLTTRVHINDPIVQQLFKLSRDLCFSIHSARMKKLKEMSEK